MTKDRKEPMTEREKVERDIVGLRESIRRNWLDLARADELQLSAEDKANIRKNTNLLIDALKEVLEQLDRMNGRNS